MCVCIGCGGKGAWPEGQADSVFPYPGGGW